MKLFVSGDLTPAVCCRLSSAGGNPAGLVDLLLDRRVLTGSARALSAELSETMRLALSEILFAIFEYSVTDAERDDGDVSLWLEPGLMICSIRFTGAPLPPWLLANWDRGREPANLSGHDSGGWGWLLVRDAIDTVIFERRGDTQILFLEKRL